MRNWDSKTCQTKKGSPAWENFETQHIEIDGGTVVLVMRRTLGPSLWGESSDWVWSKYVAFHSSFPTTTSNQRNPCLFTLLFFVWLRLLCLSWGYLFYWTNSLDDICNIYQSQDCPRQTFFRHWSSFSSIFSLVSFFLAGGFCFFLVEIAGTDRSMSLFF